MRAARAAAIAWIAALGACTDLDALSGREPALPWSPFAERGLLRGPDGAETAYRVETTVTADGFELVTDLPGEVKDCLADRGADLCADGDLDGLVDRWEDVLLDRLRPFVRIDEGDPLRVDASGRVGSVGRVAPVVGDGGEAAIRVFLVLGYSRDYGRCTFDEHLGDSERVVLDLARTQGARGAVRLTRAFTAAHEGTSQDSSDLFEGEGLLELEYAEDPHLGQPRWAVYASRSKHATFASPALCEANESWIFCGDEDCAAGRVDSPSNELLMPVVNAGEPDAPLADQMMDEPIWDDVDFCGGLGHGDEPCASPLREKLLLDPILDAVGR